MHHNMQSSKYIFVGVSLLSLPCVEYLFIYLFGILTD